MDFKSFKLIQKSFITEKDIETQILEYLSYKGTVYKMNFGGKPIQINGYMQMIPFQSKYKPDGFSDVLFLCEGKSYFFEVKKPEIKKHIFLNYTFYSNCNPKNLKGNRKTYAEQVQFINRVKKEGFVAGFVSSIEDVKKFLNLN